jgi:hypothetical protein
MDIFEQMSTHCSTYAMEGLFGPSKQYRAKYKDMDVDALLKLYIEAVVEDGWQVTTTKGDVNQWILTNKEYYIESHMDMSDIVEKVIPLGDGFALYSKDTSNGTLFLDYDVLTKKGKKKHVAITDSDMVKYLAARDETAAKQEQS